MPYIRTARCLVLLLFLLASDPGYGQYVGEVTYLDGRKIPGIILVDDEFESFTFGNEALAASKLEPGSVNSFYYLTKPDLGDVRTTVYSYPDQHGERHFFVLVDVDNSAVLKEAFVATYGILLPTGVVRPVPGTRIGQRELAAEILLIKPAILESRANYTHDRAAAGFLAGYLYGRSPRFPGHRYGIRAGVTTILAPEFLNGEVLGADLPVFEVDFGEAGRADLSERSIEIYTTLPLNDAGSLDLQLYVGGKQRQFKGNDRSLKPNTKEGNRITSAAGTGEYISVGGSVDFYLPRVFFFVPYLGAGAGFDLLLTESSRAVDYYYVNDELLSRSLLIEVMSSTLRVPEVKLGGALPLNSKRYLFVEGTGGLMVVGRNGFDPIFGLRAGINL